MTKKMSMAMSMVVNMIQKILRTMRVMSPG